MIEYGIMVKSMPVKPELQDLNDDDLGKIMSQAIVRHLLETTEDMNPQGLKNWRILSHCLTRLDAHLLLSYLVEKER